MVLITIISVGVYSGYILLIKHTKEGQVKQQSAILGKKTIEEIKGYTSGKSFDITSKTTLDLSDDMKLDIKNGGFEKEIKFDNNFKESADGVYNEKISIKKAKVGGNDIDLDSRMIKKTVIDELTTNIIEYKLEMIKDAGFGKQSYIQYEHEEENKHEVKDTDDKITFYVYIKTVDGKKSISIIDLDGNELLPEKKQELDSNKINNQVDLHINFSGYNKGENEKLDNIEINIYNLDEETNKNITNIYIEKAKDLGVDVKKLKEDANIYDNRSQSGTIPLGTLYNIQVDISKDGKALFTGYSNQNIDIK